MKQEDPTRLSRRRLLQALAASAFACVHGQRPARTCPAADTLGGLCAERRRLVAFDNIHAEEPLVVWPHSVPALQRFLRELPAHRRVTFRSGGKSIDGQALNDDVVVMLTHRAFRDVGEVTLDESGTTALITVGASAPWREILCKTTASGFVPRAVPSAGEITAGGGLSSHSISRFSPVWHKEGDHVRQLKVVLPDGCLRTLRRQAPEGSEERDLFLGVVAGFGFLGAIVEVTYELLRVAPPGAHVQVATRNSIFHSDNDLWVDLLRTLRERSEENEAILRHAVTATQAAAGARPPARPAASSDKQPRPADREPAADAAVSATPWLEDRQALIIPEPAATVYASLWWSASCRMEERAMLCESRYVYDRPLSPMILYEPDNELMGVVEELMSSSAWLNRAIQSAATQQFANAAVAVTPIEGFTFFQDANLLAREREYTGARSIVLQQTFILPDRAGEPQAARFLTELSESVRGDFQLPTLCDLLWLPQDANPFLLSATSRASGFALTLTYLRPDDSDQAQIQRELKLLSARCLARGGRIHLVKSVEVADQQTLEQTYHEPFERFRALKACYDPHGKLINAFYRRVLGDRVVAPAVCAPPPCAG